MLFEKNDETYSVDDNDIYKAPNFPTTPGWKLVIKFGTKIVEGDYEVKISTIEDGTTNLYGLVSGGLTEVDTNGYITVEDSYIWDDNINDYRYRDPYDGYNGIDAFDIEISVTELLVGGPPFKVKYRVAPSLPLQWRISAVIEDTEALRFPDGSLDRTIMDGLFDAWYMKLAYVSLHWDFIRLQLNSDQTPQTHGWNRYADAVGWRKFNQSLARSSQVPSSHPKISHMYLFMHGNPTGVGDSESGRGIDHEVTAATITSLGFNKTNGLTFAFFDACSVFSSGAVLPTLLMKNGGVEGHISLTEMFAKGLHPNFSCGWEDDKMSSFANRVYLDHIEYSSDYIQWLLNVDEKTGLPLWTYKDARNKAKDGNLAGKNYNYTGVEKLMIHW